MTDPKFGQGSEPLVDGEVPLEALEDIVGGAQVDAEIEVDEKPVPRGLDW